MRPQLNDQFEQLPIEVLRDVIDTYVTEKQPSDADIEACEALRKSIDPHSSVPLDYDKFEKLLSSGTPLFSGRLRKKLAPHLISRSAYKTTKSFPDGHNMIGCNSSATIAIVPDTIRSFAPNAFTDCPKLAHIICTETQWGLIIYYLQRRIQGVTIIGDHKYYLSSSSFSGYRSLVYIGIPDTVTTIGSSAFRGCINLRYPMLPNTITTIDDYAFADCTFSEFVFPPAVKIIEEEVLHNCFNLTKIELPAQTTSIGDYAFSGTAISNLFIPRTVIGAWRHAFSNCPSLAIIRAEDFESLFITITNHAVIIPRHHLSKHLKRLIRIIMDHYH
ncbi:MAG: hypothetical protein COB66_03160 [Coxiella sp. (in: Bacteria)]|nr:MAG: hypothetical protein COB66_03160 [Coxiella sp. (in: g-proteobacteria)]